MAYLGVYIGDGVYANLEEGMIVLSTTDGLHSTNRIFLESEVWNNLLEYVKTTTTKENK